MALILRSFTTSSCFACNAQSTGALDHKSLTSNFAPRSNKNFVHAILPNPAAKCNGVRPAGSTAFTKTPSSSSHPPPSKINALNRSASPRLAASWISGASNNLCASAPSTIERHSPVRSVFVDHFVILSSPSASLSSTSSNRQHSGAERRRRALVVRSRKIDHLKINKRRYFWSFLSP